MTISFRLNVLLWDSRFQRHTDAEVAIALISPDDRSDDQAMTVAMTSSLLQKHMALPVNGLAHWHIRGLPD
jgi:hypothetical protein